MRKALIILCIALYLLGVIFTRAWVFPRVGIDCTIMGERIVQSVALGLIWPLYWLNAASEALAAPSQPSPEKKP